MEDYVGLVGVAPHPIKCDIDMLGHSSGNVTSGICRERSRLKEKESKRETLKRLQV